MGQGGGDKANLRKAVIGGNLAFGIGGNFGKVCKRPIAEISGNFSKVCKRTLAEIGGNFSKMCVRSTAEIGS